MKTDRFLALAVVATMFAACSNENIPVDNTKDTPHHHRFSRFGQDKVTLGGITADSWREAASGNLETE